MARTDRHMAPGDWDLRLAEDTPPDVRALLHTLHADQHPGPNVGWATLVVTSQHHRVQDVDPVGSGSAPHGLMELAEWSGIVMDADSAAPSLSGLGLAAYLGFGDRGELYTSRGLVTSNAATQMWNHLMPASSWIEWMVNGGTRNGSHPVLGTQAMTIRPSALTSWAASGSGGPAMGRLRGTVQTRAEVVAEACMRAGWEWDITAQGALVYGDPADVWPTRNLIIGPGLGDDPAWVVVSGHVDSSPTSCADWANRAIAVNDRVSNPYVRGRSTGGSGWRDLRGQLIQWEMLIDHEDGDEVESNADFNARSFLELVGAEGPYLIRPEIEVTVDSLLRHGQIRQPQLRPGMTALLWDPLHGTSDPSQLVTVAGEATHPTSVRIASATQPWPPGGFYILRRTGSAPTSWAVHDLTEWVPRDTSPVRIEVGRPAPPLHRPNRPVRNR